jgi:hypothetical protein
VRGVGPVRARRGPDRTGFVGRIMRAGLVEVGRGTGLGDEGRPVPQLIERPVNRFALVRLFFPCRCDHAPPHVK